MITSLLTLGSRWTMVGGKGGVGKTTTAAALAVSLADSGDRVLVLSTDPAHSLGDVLGVELGSEPRPVPGVPGLEAMEVDAVRELDRFLGTRRGAILQLIERGTYLERADVEEFSDLAVPGMDEVAAMFRLLELAGDAGRRLVIDTAPTGHTLRLLDLPRVARDWLGALEAMQRKHQAVALALAGAYHPDEAALLLDQMDADLRNLSDLLTDPARTRFVLVTTPEPVVLAEARRYRAELEERGIRLGGIVVNRSLPRVDPAATGPGMAFVPLLDPEPTGVDGLRRFAGAPVADPALRPVEDAPREQQPVPVRRPGALHVGERFVPPLDRRLYVVGGKGGVGKSTAASALALRLCQTANLRVLLLSTDPAGSLGDVFGHEVAAQPAGVPEAPGLWLQQMDARAVWDTFRGRFRNDTETLFSGLLTGGLSASADQEVVQRLVDLAPPGVDELMALLEVVDVTGDRPYDALVLDTAPTGHLLRLLELPDLALQWTHAILRLLLKYREVVPLGGLAEHLLRLARSLRDLRERLRDPAQTWVLAVALPEALSVPETARLLTRLRALDIGPGALLINRLLRDDSVAEPDAVDTALALLHIGSGLPAAAAPRWEQGPASVADLLRFMDGWRRISP